MTFSLCLASARYLPEGYRVYQLTPEPMRIDVLSRYKSQRCWTIALVHPVCSPSVFPYKSSVFSAVLLILDPLP
jgi:hypothetical protein